MRIIKGFSQSILASCILLASTLTIAHEGHHVQSMPSDAPMKREAQQTASFSHQTESHAAHQMVQAKSDTDNSAPVSVTANHPVHDHRKEHGAQIYSMTTIDHQWLVDEDGQGALKSELESRIGTDENKLFIKAHISKSESQAAEYDVKALYSRNISDFWDVQAGARYRYTEWERDHQQADTEEKLDAVMGLHGMAPYFFETDAYLYAGQDKYLAFSLETERDLLLTQKLILKPYLNLEIVLLDEAKYAQRTGLNNAALGLETRYEVSKKFMPYLNVAYEYAKGNAHTAWQEASQSEKNWVYGAGVRIRF